MRKPSQAGIAHLGGLLLIIVIAAVAFIGYKVEQNHNRSSVASVGSNTPVAAQTIQSKADLNSAENTLNNQNIDGDLNPNQFNQDVSSLL